MSKWICALFMLMVFQSLTWGAPVATAPATRAAVVSKPVVKDGVSISVLTDRATIAAGEQPEFAVRFLNTSADYINLYDVDAFWDWTFEFTNVEKGVPEPGPWRLKMDSIPHRYPIAHKQIKAGESLDLAINLNDPPFTFVYEYAGPMRRTIMPVRHLSPGTYQMRITIGLKNPFGPGYHLWEGPATSEPIEFTIAKADPKAKEVKPSAEEISAYDAAIKHVTEKLQPFGLWMNGMSPDIKLPKSADAEDVIAAAVNMNTSMSKRYEILRVQPFDRLQKGASAGLVRVGKEVKVLVFFSTGETGWWTRFYDTELVMPSAK